MNLRSSSLYRGDYYIKSRSSENDIKFCRRLLMRRPPYNVHCKTRPFHVIAAYPANKIYKKVWCTCKVKVKVPSKLILFVCLFLWRSRCRRVVGSLSPQCFLRNKRKWCHTFNVFVTCKRMFNGNANGCLQWFLSGLDKPLLAAWDWSVLWVYGAKSDL